MANLLLPLTDALCKGARPQDREYSLRDTRQPGLALRIQPCGSRSWVMRYRINGKLVRHLIGAFPETGVKAARQIAAALRAQEAEAPPPPSVAPLFGSFQAEHERRYAATYKPEGLRTYRSYVRCELLPAFSGKRIDAITRQDVIRWFERYSARKPGGASRALGIFSQILRCAKTWGYLPETWRNPVTDIRMNRRRQVGTFLSERQMVELGAVLNSRMAQGCKASAALHLLSLTGCRVSEVLLLEWGDVLPDRLRLRDSKTGPRDVPLGVPVRQFLKAYRKSVPRLAKVPDTSVFPLPGQPYNAIRSVWLRVRKEANLPDTLRIHDLRHSFASHAIMAGETLFSTSRLLGHSKIQTTARYAHLADTALLDCAEMVGKLILAQVASPSRGTPASPRRKAPGDAESGGGELGRPGTGPAQFPAAL